MNIMKKRQCGRNRYRNLSREEREKLIGHANNYYKKLGAKRILVGIKDLKILQREFLKFGKAYVDKLKFHISNKK